MAFDWKSLIAPAAALVGTSALTFGSAQFNASGSRKAQKRAYNYQRALNQQAFDLSQEFTTWQNLNGMSQLRQGLENAGYNPMLAVNASPSSTSFSGGSAGSFAPPPISDLGQNVTNAYKAFKLDNEKVKAEIDVLKSQAKNIDKDTSLKEFDKPLKLIGSVLNDPEVIKDKITGIKDYVDSNAKNLIENSGFKGLLSRGFWSYGDFVNDLSSYLKDKFKGNNIPFKYYKGLSKNNRIRDGVYNYKQLLKKKGSKNEKKKN